MEDQKQKNVTKSSQASELVALGTTVDITEHIQSTLKDLEISTTKLTIFEDNKAVISAVKNRAKSSLSRHVDIILKSTRRKYLIKILDLYYIQTDKTCGYVHKRTQQDIIYQIETSIVGYWRFDKPRSFRRHQTTENTNRYWRSNQRPQ